MPSCALWALGTLGCVWVGRLSRSCRVVAKACQTVPLANLKKCRWLRTEIPHAHLFLASPSCSGSLLPRFCHLTAVCRSENERNRRRDLISALRGRREQMLQALKRDGAAAQRGALFAGSSGQGAPSGQETIQTAELNATGLLSLQQEIMSQQDRDLESLEHSVAGTKHIALQINEETTLHNRLLEDLDEEVSATSSRMKAAQRRLRQVMRKGASCKTQLFVFLVALIFVVAIIIAFKIVIHL